jgi:hypothetical protein
MERDQIKKALEHLRKKDPNNPALQSYEKRLRSLTGASEKSTKGSVELYDHWKENFSSEGQKEKQKKNGNSITDLNGNRQSKGYEKEMTRRSEEESPRMDIHEQKQSELKKKFGIVTKDDITYVEAQKIARERNEKEKKKEVSTLKKGASSDKKKEENSSLGKDIKNVLVGAYQFANPFDDVSPKEATERYLKKDTSNAYKEIARGSNRAIDSATLNAMSNLDKRVNDREPYYNSEREIGEGGGTDLITSGLGYLVPGVGFVKGARAVGLGAKTGTKGLAKAGQLAKEGAVVGGAMGATEVGIREALNGKDTDWKDNLGHIAFGTATGAIADPLIHGVGRGIAKGVDVGLKKWIPDLPERLPTEGFNIPDPKGNASILPKKSDPINIDPVFNTKRYHNPDQPLNEFLGKTQKESDLLKMAKKVNYTNRELPDFSTSSHSVGKSDIDIPKDLVETATPQYWQKRYEDFATHVKQNYDTDQLTKEGLDDLWTQFARYDEPVTLEQVVDLAYKGYKEATNLNANEVWDQLGNRPTASQNAKKILGIDESMFLKNKGQQIPNLLPETGSPLSQKPITRTQFKPETEVKSLSENSLVNEINQPKSVQPVEVNQPINTPKQNESSFFNTVGKQEKISDELLQRINDFDKSYKPMSNKETVDIANKYIANDIEKAYQFVKNADKFDPRHVTVGHRLIDEFQKRGEFDRALDVVERLAEQGTKAGQSVQAFSIYGRLTPEGQLLRAQRKVNQINQNIVFEKNKVSLDEKSIQDITHAADSIQKLTGQEDVAKNVMNIMDSLKKGKTATDDDLEIIRSFAVDAKKFIGDTTPKAERTKVKPVSDVRTRDKVVDYMSQQEEVAKKRLRQRMNRANSLPVDVFYDLTIIGASKIAKGTVKFADFSEQMIREFGEEISPYIKQIWDKSAESYNLQSEKMNPKRLSEVEKIVNKATKDKALSQEEAEVVQQYLKEYLQLTGDAKLDASMQLQSTLQLLERPTFAQKISTTQTIAQLLNPKTIVRNAIGNELFYRVEQISKLVATPIDIAKSKVLGTERTVTFKSNNQGQYWHNWMLGLKAGWKGVNPMGLTTMYDLGSPAFRSKYNPMTYLEKSLGATLRSFDHAGYMRAYNKTLGEIATLKAVNEGLKGEAKKEAIARYIREADVNMMNIADQYSKYATFQDTTTLSNILQGTKKYLNRYSTFKTTDEFGLGDLILKYPKTPANLIMRALEYSPAGFVRSAHLLKRAMISKNPFDDKETVLAFTRAIVGTGGFSMMGYVLADKGILTSAGHSDFEVASLERNAGKQANSVNVSAIQRFVTNGFNLSSAEVEKGDTFVTFDWAQPVSMAIALGTGVNQSFKENDNPTLLDGGKAAFNSAGNTIINMSVLSGLNDFLSTYQGQGWSDKLEGVAKGALSSFVPTFSNQIRQVSDNTSRTTYSPGFLDESLNKVKNRIPGVEKSLPPSFDTLGNQRFNYQNGSNNPLNVFLNPSFVSKYNPSKEAQFVLDYINQTGDKTVAPRSAKKKLDGIELTGAQHAEYQRIMGEETRKGLERIVPQLEKTNNNEKIKKQLDKILRLAGEKARTELRKELKD